MRGQRPRWLILAVIVLTLVAGLTGLAIAQSGGFLSLNSPTSFPVDI